MSDDILSHLPSFPAITALGGVGSFFAFLGYWIQSRVKGREVEIGGDAGLRKDMMSEITALRKEMRENETQCEREIKLLNSKFVVFAHFTTELGAVDERYVPDSPILTRARAALHEAFPLNFAPDAEMSRLVAELAKRDKIAKE